MQYSNLIKSFNCSFSMQVAIHNGESQVWLHLNHQIYTQSLLKSFTNANIHILIKAKQANQKACLVVGENINMFNSSDERDISSDKKGLHISSKQPNNQSHKLCIQNQT